MSQHQKPCLNLKEGEMANPGNFQDLNHDLNRLAGRRRICRSVTQLHAARSASAKNRSSSPPRTVESSPAQDSFAAVDPLELDTCTQPNTLHVTDPCNETVSRQEAFDCINLALPPCWTVFQGSEGFHIVCMSQSTKNIAIQREVFSFFTGEVNLYVHRKLMSMAFHQKILDQTWPESLTATTMQSFVNRILKIVLLMTGYEICTGADNTELELFWEFDKSGYVDDNLYDETRYVKTFRSHSCELLVPTGNLRCKECKKTISRIESRFKFSPDMHFRSKTISARSDTDYSENKVQNLLASEGIIFDTDSSEMLCNILRESNLTPFQHEFIKQQYEMSGATGSLGIRWHPALVRFALLIKSTSSDDFARSRVITLPGDRTLFDYDSAISKNKEIYTENLNYLGENVKIFEKEHQHYYSLLTEEVHVSQNLVFKKSDGRLVGFVKLDEARAEMESLMKSMEGGSGWEKKHIRSTKLHIYKVKGCTNSVEAVVAVYKEDCISFHVLFERTWNVIEACEKAGVKILAMICGSSSLSRSFINMHTPACKTSCVVYSTVNLYASDRILYFVSDPSLLLKSIRDCFSKSGMDSKIHSRRLYKDGQFIVWDVIEKLYKENDRDRTEKLTAEHVYLNQSSCLKVSLAAQVLSKTVALDLKDKNWPRTAATVEFILKINDLFDNLNGAFTNKVDLVANPRLAPYADVNDKRFQELIDFQEYLLNWEEEVESLEEFSSAEKAQMTLSIQTVEDIYMTVNSFCRAVKFLLEIGADFVNAHVFSQDPLRQYSGGQADVSVDVSTDKDTDVTNVTVNTMTKRSRKREAQHSLLPAINTSNDPVPKRQKS